jgi:hypothetical protein
VKEILLNVSASKSVKSPIELWIDSIVLVALGYKSVSIPRLRREHVCDSIGSYWHDHFRACLVIPSRLIDHIGRWSTNGQTTVTIEHLVCCSKQLQVILISFKCQIRNVLTSLSNWICWEMSSKVSCIRIVDHCHASESI